MELIAPTDGPYVLWEGKKLLDFSSCDFLGLAQHPEVKKGAIKYALKYGVGTLPSSSAPQREVEAKLAHYLGKEMTILFPSLTELKAQLEKSGATLISTDTEDTASLKKAKGLKVADDTFLLGIMGSLGFGSASELSQVDAICGSLSAGIGGSGAFIAGSKKHLSMFIPSAPLSFPVIGALDCALSFIPEMDSERKTLQKNKAWLIKQFEKFPCKELRSPRLLLTFNSTEEAQAARQFFIEQQIYLAPHQDSTLIFSTTALHTPDDFDQFAEACKKWTATDLALATQSLTPTPAK